MSYKNKFLINEEMVQDEAETCIGRSLTKNENNQVFDAIQEDWMCFIQDKIHQVVDFNEMLERNKGAEKEPVHFDVYHRNKNAYRMEFVLAGSFKNEADARQYANYDFITEFDEWQIFRIDDGEKKEVWSINVNRTHSF